MAFADDPHRQREQVADADVARPLGRNQGLALGVGVEERRDPQPLVDAGPPARGHQHHHRAVEQQRPERAVRERVPATEAEQLLRAQPVQPERSGLDPGLVEMPGTGQCRQQQRVDPRGEAGQQPELHAAPAGAAPVQAADQARRELRHRGEGHQAIGRQGRVAADPAVVRIGGQRQQQDRQAPHPKHQRSDVGSGMAFTPAAAQQHRHHQVVADHRGQRDARHDDHPGGGGEPADVGRKRQRIAALGQRQRQHEGVAGHAAVAAEQRHARRGDRHHHQRDHQQVRAEHPARLADVGDVAAFDHRHLELARQADDGEEAEQGLGEEADRRRLLEQGPGRVGDPDLVPAQPAPGEQADRHHRHQLDQRFQRDGQHHAVVVLGGVDLAGAEQGREQGHQQGHVQRRVGGDPDLAGILARQHGQAHRHRLVLQCHVGHHADQRDHGDQRGQAPGTAVAGGDEVGDGHRVLAARDQRQPFDGPPAEQQQQQRSEVDREVADPVAHGAADRAVERP